MHRLLSFACLVLRSRADYPATYPFENEVYDVMPALPETDFNPTFDAEDPGGYIFNCQNFDFESYDPSAFGSDFDTVEEEIEATSFSLVHRCAAQWYKLTTVWKLSHMYLPAYNCTARDNERYSSTYFSTRTVTMNNVQMCEPSTCCKDFITPEMPLFLDFRETVVSDVAEKNQAGFCPDMDETLFCIMNFKDTSLCNEYVLSKSSRAYLTGCYDIFVVYMRQCPVFADGGVEDDKWEPDGYWAALTADQKMVVRSMGRPSADRICHPYSYYYPTADVPASSDASTDGEDVDTPESSLASSSFYFFFYVLS